MTYGTSTWLPFLFFKGHVQQNLSWGKNSVYRRLFALDNGALHYFFVCRYEAFILYWPLSLTRSKLAIYRRIHQRQAKRGEEVSMRWATHNAASILLVLRFILCIIGEARKKNQRILLTNPATVPCFPYLSSGWNSAPISVADSDPHSICPLDPDPASASDWGTSYLDI